MTTNRLLRVLNAHSNDSRIDDIVEQWNDRHGTEIIQTEDGEWMETDDAYYCPIGEVYYSDDSEFEEYRDGRDEGHAHRDSLRNARSFFQCDRSEVWFSFSHFVSCEVDGETICYDWHSDEIYYWESDGSYHWEEEPAPENHRAGYHSGSRYGWQYKEGIGIELEMLADDESDLEDICEAARAHDFLAEEDGSLDDQLGVEIVSPPLSLKAWEGSEANPWQSFLSSIAGKASAHNAGTGYGIHVSLSLSLFSELQLAKFVVFINQHVALSQTVAQRRNIYSGGYQAQTRCKKFKASQTGKYEPVKVDDKRAEVRIFRANMRWDRLQKCVQYCLAVRAFVSDQSVADICRGGLETAFRSYVASNKKTFPQLNQFLKEN